ncbi:hypothetical protein L1F30_13135 [Simiduia sp. 21SJ11W-1]|uniref:hypothetical protein n=1 Tax=Simiduia sp. 21SJ11W-1 TaxID=2909669 RepID=UPI0020A1BE54|nr:hypothetical protein [Simiduia sp. 21SJ11W-1]UTA47100.1 hypothetical protein L1F30_13135 [Simiduia sp. 21SJ11W-1]
MQPNSGAHRSRLTSPRLVQLVAALCLCAAGTLADTAPPNARPTITFTCAVVPDSRVIAVLHALYTSAFDSLGYDFVLKERSGKRSLVDVNQGRVDGECARNGQLMAESGYHNLVRVDAELIRFNINLYSFDATLDALTTAQIIERNLTVGYQRGALVQDLLLATLPSHKRILFTELTSGLRMLHAGRINLVAAPGALMGAAVNKTQLPAPTRVGVLASFGAYPYLNSQHADLAAPLAAAIKAQLNNPAHPLHQFSEPH